MLAFSPLASGLVASALHPRWLALGCLAPRLAALCKLAWHQPTLSPLPHRALQSLSCSVSQSFNYQTPSLTLGRSFVSCRHSARSFWSLISHLHWHLPEFSAYYPPQHPGVHNLSCPSLPMPSFLHSKKVPRTLLNSGAGCPHKWLHPSALSPKLSSWDLLISCCQNIWTIHLRSYAKLLFSPKGTFFFGSHLSFSIYQPLAHLFPLFLVNPLKYMHKPFCQTKLADCPLCLVPFFCSLQHLTCKINPSSWKLQPVSGSLYACPYAHVPSIHQLIP